jgi:hypothetical protein
VRISGPKAKERSFIESAEKSRKEPQGRRDLPHPERRQRAEAVWKLPAVCEYMGVAGQGDDHLRLETVVSLSQTLAYGSFGRSISLGLPASAL